MRPVLAGSDGEAAIVTSHGDGLIIPVMEAGDDYKESGRVVGCSQSEEEERRQLGREEEKEGDEEAVAHGGGELAIGWRGGEMVATR